MKGAIAIAVASAALASAFAGPAKIEARASTTTSSSVPTVTVQGNAFFAGDDRFYIRGVDYQPGGSSANEDPIADVAGCTRDVVEFKKLGINTIRVYTVDNTANHDTCMGLLADAGIYLALDVNTPLYSLNRDDPAESYNAVYLQSLFATVDAFANYDNTLLFFSGNEVINSENNTNCAPYVKAVTRDLKQYIGTRGYRQIPVGYSAADVESIRYDLAEYMNCGTADQRSDFFAFNDYEWCDPSTFVESGWSANVALFSNYSIPLFLSEYGCITGTREWEEVAALYNTEMTGVYSGGLVYEYSEEGNGYGLVTISGDSVSENAAFTALVTAFANTTDPSGNGGYTENGTASTCPTDDSTWTTGTEFTGDELPAIPSGAEVYFKDGAGTGPGLNGTGSQDAGGASTGTASAGSGTVTSTASNSGTSSTSTSTTSAKAGASSVMVGDMGITPFVCTAAVILSAFFGAALL